MQSPCLHQIGLAALAGQQPPRFPTFPNFLLRKRQTEAAAEQGLVQLPRYATDFALSPCMRHQETGKMESVADGRCRLILGCHNMRGLSNTCFTHNGSNPLMVSRSLTNFCTHIPDSCYLRIYEAEGWPAFFFCLVLKSGCTLHKCTDHADTGHLQSCI